MIVGYARTSSLAQVAGLEAQERDLRAAGCDEDFPRTGVVGSRATAA